MKIAEVVKTNEEARQQKRRFEQLQVLKAQVEEDERVAKGLMEQELLENQTQKIAFELTDEEYAKLVQDEEKKKYEDYLEREKQRKLKKEREDIGKTQQQRSEAARLAIPSGGKSRRDKQSRERSKLTSRFRVNSRNWPGGVPHDSGNVTGYSYIVLLQHTRYVLLFFRWCKHHPV